jgi:hypothetical protein
MATDIGELLVKLSADLKSLDSGLKQARGDLAGFQNYANSFGDTIKKALTFTVGILGISALIGELKSLASGVIEVGSKLQTMKLAAYAVGQNFGYTAGVIDSFVQDLKKVRVSSTDAYEAVSQFASKGLDPGQLQSIAQAARDLAVAAGKSPQDMFTLLIDSIVTGTPRALRQAKIPIKEFQDSVVAEGKSMDDNLKLSAQERSQVMIDLILKYAKTVEGVSESTAGSYSRQLGQIKYMSTEAKEALWDFMEPMLTAITGEKIKVWSDLLGWLKANRDELKEWGTTAGEFIKQVWGVVSSIVKWTVENGSLLKSLLELAIAFKLAGYAMALAGALQAAGAAAAASGTLAMGAVAGWTAMAGSIKLAAIALAAYAIYKTFTEPGQLTGPTSSGDPFADVAGGAREKDLAPKKSKLTVLTDQQKFANFTAAERQKEVDAAIAKWNAQFGDKTGTGKGGGGKGDKGLNEDMLSFLTQYLDAKRKLELKGAEESYQNFKADNAKKKAELDRDLAEGKIAGLEYNKALIKMAEEETAASLKLIDAKIAKEKEASAWAQGELRTRAEAGQISPEALDLSLKRLQIDLATRLKDLEGEAYRDKIKLQRELIDLSAKEYQNRKLIKDALATGREGAALGPVQMDAAALSRLERDRSREREGLVIQGATPGDLSKFDATTSAQVFNKKYGEQISGMANSIATGLTSLVDSIGSGTQDLMKSANSMFKGLLTEVLKPGIKALTQGLMDGFKSMFGSLGPGLASALLGVVAIVGMLLTSTKQKSSFSASGVQSNVTSTEAVRGIIAGETSIPIAKVSESLSEALTPHLGVLRQIEANTRGGGAGASPVNINYRSDAGNRATTRESIDAYFREYLLQGAGSR